MRNKSKSRNKIGTKKLAPPNYLIFCEGKQTEPNYFNGLKQRISEKFGDRISVVPAIKVKGTGLNTESLVKYVKQYINKSPKVYGFLICVILLHFKAFYPVNSLFYALGYTRLHSNLLAERI